MEISEAGPSHCIIGELLSEELRRMDVPLAFEPLRYSRSSERSSKSAPTQTQARVSHHHILIGIHQSARGLAAADENHAETSQLPIMVRILLHHTFSGHTYEEAL